MLPLSYTRKKILVLGRWGNKIAKLWNEEGSVRSRLFFQKLMTKYTSPKSLIPCPMIQKELMCVQKANITRSSCSRPAKTNFKVHSTCILGYRHTWSIDFTPG